MKLKLVSLLLFTMLAFSCSPKKTYKLTIPGEHDNSDGTYGGQKGFDYPEDSVTKLNEFLIPMGFYAVYRNHRLTCCTNDSLLSNLPTEYQKQKLDSMAYKIYHRVFGTKFEPNKIANMASPTIVLRVDYGDGSGADNPAYSIDYWYYNINPIFRELQPW